MRVSIRWKLVLAIGLPFLSLSLAFLAIDYQALKRAAYQQTETYVLEVADRYAKQLDGEFDTVAQVGRTTASFLETHPDLTETEIYQQLASNVKQKSLIYGSCIAFAPYAFDPQRRLFAPYKFRGQTGPEAKVDPVLEQTRDADGLLKMDVGADAYDYTDPKWDWFRIPQETGRAFWTEPFFDEDAGNVIMCTYIAPFFRNGSFRGTVNIDVKLDTVHDRLTDVPLRDVHCSVLSARGTIISDPTDSLIRENLFHIAARYDRPDVTELARRIIGPERGVHRVIGLVHEKPMLLAHAPIASTGWAFLAGVPEAVILAPVYRQLQLRTMLVLGVVLLILVIVLLSGLRIAAPIARLADAVRQLARGDLEMRSVDIRSVDEIGELARAFNKMVKDLRAHVDALTLETANRERVESELRVARSIQNSLLPQTFPPFPDRPEFDLHAINAPALLVAGDFFDFFFVDDDALVFIIADVSGKGIPAAMYMAVARTVLRNQAATTSSPAEILTRTNSILVSDNVQSMFVTLFLGRYDTRTGRLRYANAGHPRPYVIDPAGSRLAQPFGRITGPILGVLEREQYEEDQIDLAIGSKLVLYTDGVPEARAPSGEFYRDERLAALLERYAAEPVEGLCDRVVAAVHEFQVDHLSDDVTLLVLKRNA